MITIAATAKRSHIPRQSEGARSSAIGWVGALMRVAASIAPRRRSAPTLSAGPERSAGSLGRFAGVFSARNRELLGLLPSALLVTAGFTAIFIQSENSTPRA